MKPDIKEQKLMYFRFMLLFAIALETGFTMYFHGRLTSNAVNEFGLVLTSLFIGFSLIVHYYGKQVQYNVSKQDGKAYWQRAALYGIVACGLVLFFISVAHVLKVTPDYKESDIIPTIQIAVRRFLAGQKVYAPIKEWGNQPVTYLPLHWMPYIPAEVLRIDYRWIAVGIFSAAAVILIFRAQQASTNSGVIALMLFVYLAWTFVKWNAGIIAVSVELMIAGYYMLFVTGISKPNPWLRGLAISLCLLSRYSLVLWLPLWAFVELMSGSKTAFFRSTSVILCLILALYIIPFLSHDWNAFYRGYQWYNVAALGEWNKMEDNGLPYHMNNGFGFARMFYQHIVSYSIPDRLRSLQKAHLAVCAGSVFAGCIAYWIIRRRINKQVFLMASFKIYLTLFLAFIQVPYPYLMITGVAVSIAIFAETARWKRLAPLGVSELSG